MTERTNCPNNHGEMALRRIDKETFFKGEKINYQFETFVCDECGTKVGTIEQAAAAQNALADAYREKIGLLSGGEIKKKRAALGWSQQQLAKRAGVGIASVKRWENGIVQTKSMNQALKSAFNGTVVGNRYTGNRAAISIPRIKLVLRVLEEMLGFELLIEGDKMLFAAKYLWYSDMVSFKKFGKSLTGATYAALPHGPQLNNYSELVETIQSANELDAKPLTNEERSVLVRVALKFPTKRLVFAAAHKEDVWKRRAIGDLIPYTEAEKLTGI